MRRMYGDFEMNMEGPGGGGGRQQGKVRKRRFIDEPDIFIPPGAFAANAGETVEAGDSYFGQLRKKRQAAAGGSRNRGGSALISVVSPATCFCVFFQLRATSAQDRRATITNNKPVG